MTAASLEVVPTASWADAVADRLADRLAARPELVLCLPTGATPLPMYERLPGALARRGVSAAGASIVLLDEYLGLPPGHRARCDEVLQRHVVQTLAPARVVRFDVDRLEPAAACQAYDESIAALGGLDLVVLGLGRNGHIGMNEPGSTPDAPTRMV